MLVILIVNAISGMTDADGKTAANSLKKDEAGKRLTSNQLPALRFADNSSNTVKPLYIQHVDNWFLKLVLYNLNEYIFKNYLSTYICR